MRLRAPGGDAWRRARSLFRAPPLHDTYHRLLENPSERSLDRCRLDLPHDTPTFSKPVYENSRGKRFFSRAQAYRDWVAVGRGRGLAFNDGLNTCLKVILKIKDDADLLPRWMDYHGRLVGWHNIIVMDCGSTDENYLSALASYEDRVLIFSYPHYYDTLHNVELNRDFYSFVARNCKYLCVVDADEFLFGYQDGTIGRDNVLKILSEGDAPIYPGTWYPNAAVPVDREGGGPWRRPLEFSISPSAIASGTINGKAVVRADICLDIKHVGHNLHVAEVAARIRPDACGRIGVLHVSNLGPRQARTRSLRHLKAKGAVPGDMPDAAVDAFLDDAMARGALAEAALTYAHAFRRAGEAGADSEGPTFETDLIAGPGIEVNPDFQRPIEAFDFSTLLPR